MEKLIELLNEYRKEKGEKNLNGFEVSQTLDSLNYLRLFIKWLVDNNKIDIQKAKYYRNRIYIQEYGEGDFCCTDYEYVLMLLAIQDEPIEFLISVLK